MNSRSVFATLIFLLCCSACKKEKPFINPSDKLEGTWTLQKQEIAIYTGSNVDADSVFHPDLDYSVQLQFKGNSNFYSTFLTYPTDGGNHGQGLIVGNYELSGSTFTTSGGNIRGLLPADNFFNNAVIRGGTAKEHSIEVKTLTAGSLVFHTEWIYAQGASAQTFKATQDYYFIK